MSYYHTWDGWGDSNFHCLGISKGRVLAWGKANLEEPQVEELTEEEVIDLLDSEARMSLRNLLNSLKYLEEGELVEFWGGI